MKPRDAKGLDETRRLLYMALAVPMTTKYELVGTLVNSLAHHVGVDMLPMELLAKLVSLVESGADADAVYVADLIDNITAQLDGG